MVLCCVGVAFGCGDGANSRNPEDLQGQPVIYDFTKRLPAARVLEETACIDLGTDPAARGLREGWGDGESRSDGTTWAWAVSRRAEIEFVVFDTTPTRLHFRAWPFAWDGAPDQTVTASVNGRTIGSAVLAPGAAEYSLRVPRGTLVAGVNRVAFDFAYVEEVRARRSDSDDPRTLAAAFDFVGFDSEDDAVSAGYGSPPAPETGDDAVVLAPATGVVFALKRNGETTLSFSLDVDGAAPPDFSKVVVWSQRAGAAPVELLAAEVAGVLGRQLAFRVLPGEGRLEIGFAVTGGECAADDGDWALVVTQPRLYAEKNGGEKTSNVLMVVVDTLRADRLGVYGSALATPNIDRLAARGVTFQHALSHIPITGPSHSSIFTSLIPAEHGVHNNGQILGSESPVLAELLRDDGRNTAGVVSLGVLKGRFGLGRGFEIYRDEFPVDWMKDAAEVNAEVMDLLDGSLPEPFFLWVHYSDPHEPYGPPDIEYPEVALDLNSEFVHTLAADGRGHVVDLDLAPGENVLRFVHEDEGRRRLFRLTTLRVDDPEVGVIPGAGWQSSQRGRGKMAYQSVFPATMLLRNPAGESRRVRLELACNQELPMDRLKERYDLEVEYADREIGRLLNFMEERNLLANTLVIFVSDHGEGMGDHNHLGHLSQLYDSLLRVPLIMVYPGHLPEGMVIDESVALVDVLPTVSDLLALETPKRISGSSLVPLIRRTGREPRPIVAETHRPEAYSEKRALVKDGFKYIHSWLDDREWEELYDLAADAEELRDLSAIEVERLETLRAALRTRLLEALAADVVEAELSTEEIDRLRALGYIH